jgi:hypothetical protein
MRQTNRRLQILPTGGQDGDKNTYVCFTKCAGVAELHRGTKMCACYSQRIQNRFIYPIGLHIDIWYFLTDSLEVNR